MKAYLQGPNGEETELEVTEPDPVDGTYCVGLDDLYMTKDSKVDLRGFWIRIVPSSD